MTVQRNSRLGAPVALAAIAAAAVVLGGCGLGSLTSGIGGGMFGGGSAAKPESEKLSEEAMLTAAKADSAASGIGAETAAGCPRFQPWSRDSAVTIYEAGRVGDGLAVMHKGEITKTARECNVTPGRVTVKYGFSGKVLLGPRGKSGTVSLPLTVFVTDAKRERIAMERLKIDVPVALDKPIGYFSTVREISFVVPEGSRAGEFEVFVGFDRNTPNAG
ncbi:MAG: hypothetical protein KGP27_11095 [Hyphomicrobiales bacterium]|nr:hypothetical protein [Hyphomicrobiales bacterium]